MEQLKQLTLDNNSVTHGEPFVNLFNYNSNYTNLTGAFKNLNFNSGLLETFIFSNPLTSGCYVPGEAMFALKDNYANLWIGVKNNTGTTELYNTNYQKSKTFEDYYELIEKEINKRKNKWTLTSIAWFDFADVSQILKIHIAKKWDMFDQNQPIGPWLSILIANQISNLLRNLYGNYCPPCNKCVCAEADDGCSVFTKKSNICPLLAKWEKSKLQAYNTKLPLALEYHSNEVFNIKEQSLDRDKNAQIIHEKMKEILQPGEWKIYSMLYIDNLSEEQVIKNLGFVSESRKHIGRKQINILKKLVIKKAREIVYTEEMEF